MSISRKNILLALSDPASLMKYALKGKESLVSYQLSKFLGVSKDVIAKFGAEILADSFQPPISDAPGMGGATAILEIYSTIRVTRPETVVETGVAAGFSSRYILAALRMNGRGQLYSIDLPNYETQYLPKLGISPSAIIPAGKMPGYIVPEELRTRWTLIEGRSQDLIGPLLNKLATIDVFFHDGEHTYDNMMFEFGLAWEHLSPGGVLLVDNINWNDAFEHFARNLGMNPQVFWFRDLGGLKKPLPLVHHYRSIQ